MRSGSVWLAAAHLELDAQHVALGLQHTVIKLHGIAIEQLPSFAQRVATQRPARTVKQSTVDGFLTDDGLTLFYVTGPAIGAADMYVASRRSTDEPFADLTPLSDLNSASDERDPWLSADGARFYFSSDRTGRYAIYEVDVLEREP